MAQQTERAILTVRCRWCRTDLARMVPEPPPVGWRVDRLERVPAGRQPWRVGVSGLGSTRYGLAADDGTLPSPRILPVPVTGDQTSFTCRRCRFESSPVLAELRDRAFRAERKGQRMLLFP